MHKLGSKDGLSEDIDKIGKSLANVILQQGQKETVLGQAWLVATNRLITCGHVVERFAKDTKSLYLKFPFSGNVYPVSAIRLHPSFVRQPDQLVKFDLAVLETNLGQPETEAEPLPFSYEQELRTNQKIWAIRYPAHLGQLSAAMQPLSQEGKFLGYLRKHDSFHLLHDLALAPGDSGSPISDGKSIIAIHCGDTATLPGLNLPTTSIRLALWVDALRDLGINESQRKTLSSSNKWLIPSTIGFFLSFLLASAITYQICNDELKANWSVQEPKVLPLHISFNKPIHGYKRNEDVELNLVPASNCYVFLFQVDSQDKVAVLYPQLSMSPFLKAGESRTINYFGHTKLTAGPSRDKCHLVVIDGNSSQGKKIASEILKEGDMQSKDREGQPLLIEGKAFIERLIKLKNMSPELLTYSVFDAVSSD